jgi:acyl carrier protein
MVEVSADEVRVLLVERITAVLGVDGAGVSDGTSFEEDLHADSLDLVEVVEGVERALRDRGVDASVPDEALVSIRTVGDAVARVHERLRPLAP